MSGPKYGTIQIEARRLQALVRQFEIQLENTLCKQLESQISSEMDRFSAAVKELEDLKCEQAIVASETLLAESESLAILKEQYFKAKEIAAYVTKSKRNSSALQDELATLQIKVKMLHNLIRVLSSSKASLLNEYSKVVTDTKEESFKNAIWQQKNVSSVRKNSKLLEIYNKIIDVASQQDNFEEIHKQLDAIICNHNVDETYRIDLLTQRLEALKVELLSNRKTKRIQEMQSKCKALYALLGGETLNLPDNVVELEQLINTLEEETKKKEESKFVALAMQEAMQDVGYSVISSETLNRQKNETERRLFDFSDNSVLSVSTSDSGSIMFEVMGRKKGDGLTQSQRTAVKNDMEKFCPDYDVIKKKLLEKGIELSNERLFPPDEKYVREIDVKGTIETKSRRAAKVDEKEVKYQDV